MYTPRLYKAQMPRFLCPVYTYSTRLQLSFTYTHSFGTGHTHMTFPPPGLNTVRIASRELRDESETTINS